MPQISQKPLKPNPYITYRDAETGRWVVVEATATGEFVPPKSRMPILKHSERQLVPVLAESILTVASCR